MKSNAQAETELADAEGFAVMVFLASSLCEISSLFSVISPRPNKVQPFQLTSFPAQTRRSLRPSSVLRPQARVVDPSRWSSAAIGAVAVQTPLIDARL